MDAKHPLSSDQTSSEAPINVQIVEDGAILRVSWTADRTDRLDATLLWSMCPSAAGKRRRMDGVTAPAAGTVKLTATKAIGRYAINLSFSDGHDRGIYPWGLLRELAALPTVEDFIAA
ncbi:MAG: gamma-butyrobetaine hydroxylase-like domain-containing protein [Pseudomonadota bacterium]